MADGRATSFGFMRAGADAAASAKHRHAGLPALRGDTLSAVPFVDAGLTAVIVGWKAVVRLLVACVLATLMSFVCVTPNMAWADDQTDAVTDEDIEIALFGEDDGEPADVEAEEGVMPDFTSYSLKKLKQIVKDKQASRDELQGEADSLAAAIEENLARLAEIEEQIPEKQAQAEHAVSARYKVQRQYGSLLDILLDSEDMHSFIAGVRYIEAASKAQVGELSALRAQRAECESEQVRLENEKGSIDNQLKWANAVLDAATAARDEAQRRFDAVRNARLKADGADWSAGKKAFVKEWGPRIDRYVKGSPLAGQGDTFAKAAWDNHIDPRFSVAISEIESSKGRICIKPHNAWGWGAAEPNPSGLASSWKNWKDAINAHAKGLARGYGYTVSIAGAKKYCPPNWEVWYVTVVSGMNSI